MEININPKLILFKNMRMTIYASFLILVIIQFFISDFSMSTFSISICILILTCLITNLFLRPGMLSEFVFPVLLTFSFNFGALSGPLFFKTIFFQPLFSNLINPLNTFYYLIIAQIIIMLGLLIFINSKILRSISLVLSKGLSYLKNFKEPNLQFLNFLFVSYFVFWIIIFFYDQGINTFSDYGSVFIKFIEGTRYLIFIPVLYYVKFCLVDKTFSKKKLFIFLFFFVTFLGMVALAINGRTIFVQFFVILLFLLILLFFFQKNLLKSTKITKFFFTLIVISILLLTLFNNVILSTRSERNDQTALQQLKFSIDTFILDKSNLTDKMYYSDEGYANNLSVDRLIFPKYFDLFYFEATEEKRHMFIDFYNEKFISIFPLPVLNLLGLKIEKANYSISSKSLLENTKGGGLHSLGSIVAEFNYVFGNFFIFVWLGFVLLIFTFFHSFQKKNDNKIILSPVALIFVWSIYHFFFTDSIHQSIGIIRHILQTSIVYYFFFQIFRLKIKI